MELYIQIVDGKPYAHPMFGDNFREAFPHIDVNNLPPEFAKFERVPCPNLATTFQVDDVSYQFVDGVVKDVWTVREMTDAEREEKIRLYTDTANIGVANAKALCIQKIAEATTDAERKAWEAGLAKFNAWVLVDPFDAKIPDLPHVSADGVVGGFANDTSGPGSAPNVVG